jgi:hypothetical protein
MFGSVNYGPKMSQDVPWNGARALCDPAWCRHRKRGWVNHVSPTATLIGISAGYAIYTYFDVNTSEFDDAANRPLWTDATRVRTSQNHPMIRKDDWNAYYG